MRKLIDRNELQRKLAATGRPTLVEALPAKLLEHRGYTRVSVYAGGKQDWTAAGLALERETTTA